jgi:hypothetical protein
MSEVNQAPMNSEEGSRAIIEAKIIARAWKDAKFKEQLLSDPKSVLGSYIGKSIPDDVEIKVVEESSKILYLVLPVEPTNESELTEAQLEAIAGGYFKLLWTGLCWG